jgi:hypothetical protein
MELVTWFWCFQKIFKFEWAVDVFELSCQEKNVCLKNMGTVD